MDERLKRLVWYHGGRVPEDDPGEPGVILWAFAVAVVVGAVVALGMLLASL